MSPTVSKFLERPTCSYIELRYPAISKKEEEVIDELLDETTKQILTNDVPFIRDFLSVDDAPGLEQFMRRRGDYDDNARGSTDEEKVELEVAMGSSVPHGQEN